MGRKHFKGSTQTNAVKPTNSAGEAIMSDQRPTFEVANGNNGEKENEPKPFTHTEVYTPTTTVLSKMDMMRCKQAALDVVLDRVSLLRAQARVMDVIDSALWAEAFKLIKIEVANCQHVLDEGLTFEEVILNAMRDGVDMVELADTLGVEFSQIAEVVLNID